MTSPSDMLITGVEFIDPVLSPAGFRFELCEVGRGSGGDFAWGEYVRGNRRLELHFRHSLGLVTYHLGELWIAHDAYLRALNVPRAEHQYPGVSDDPLDGFRHLAHDLDRYLAEFLAGEAMILHTAAAAEIARLDSESHNRRASYEGDGRTRAQARLHFQAGEYDQVVSLLESVRYPDLLPESERRMLQLARRRAGGLTTRFSRRSRY